MSTVDEPYLWERWEETLEHHSDDVHGYETHINYPWSMGMTDILTDVDEETAYEIMEDFLDDEEDGLPPNVWADIQDYDIQTMSYIVENIRETVFRRRGNYFFDFYEFFEQTAQFLGREDVRDCIDKYEGETASSLVGCLVDFIAGGGFSYGGRTLADIVEMASRDCAYEAVQKYDHAIGPKIVENIAEVGRIDGERSVNEIAKMLASETVVNVINSYRAEEGEIRPNERTGEIKSCVFDLLENLIWTVYYKNDGTLGENLASLFIDVDYDVEEATEVSGNISRISERSYGDELIELSISGLRGRDTGKAVEMSNVFAAYGGSMYTSQEEAREKIEELIEECS